MRSGFTLVELSIVLVIIGLLVGGILVAQSMIGTSKIVATAAQIQQFDAGVMSFKAKYNYLPGDAPTFGGDGNGLIDTPDNGGSSLCGDNHGIMTFQCEIANFWNEMSPEQFPTNYGFNLYGTQAIVNGVGKNVPAAKIGSTNSFFFASALSTDGRYADTTNPKNYYTILDGAKQLQTSTPDTWWHTRYTVAGNVALPDATSAYSSLKPAELLAMDIKFDDGKADSGNVISGSMAANYMGGGMTATPMARCSNGANYLVANNTYECTPLIRIGAFSDPQ